MNITANKLCYNLGDNVTTIPTRMGGLKKIIAIIKMLWASEK